jgi:hypothetical protein
MALPQLQEAVTYEQFRFDVYLVTFGDTGYINHQRVIANFGAQSVCDEYAQWYSEKHKAQLCINDLRTDDVRYVPELKGPTKGMWIGGAKPQLVVSNGKKTKPEPQPEKEIVSASGLSARDMAKLLLSAIKECKPLPARALAEKAGLEYSVEVRRVLVKMRDKGYIVFDNGRWKTP